MRGLEPLVHRVFLFLEVVLCQWCPQCMSGWRRVSYVCGVAPCAAAASSSCCIAVGMADCFLHTPYTVQVANLAGLDRLDALAWQHCHAGTRKSTYAHEHAGRSDGSAELPCHAMPCWPCCVWSHRYAADQLTSLVTQSLGTAPMEIMAKLQEDIDECDNKGGRNASIDADENVADWVTLVAAGTSKQDVEEVVLPLLQQA